MFSKRNMRRSRGRLRRRVAVEQLESRRLLTAWTHEGPAPITGGQVRNISPNNEVTGAIHTVVAHPTDADLLYVGATNGGIWRTENAQATQPTWTPLIDDMPSLSIGALEFDLADESRQTLVAGIGRFSSFGRTGGELSGLLRTTDGGDSWAPLGTADLAGRNISGLAVRGDLVLVSANRFGGGTLGGVYRSVNGGVTFDYLSGRDGLPRGAAFDLVSDPSNDERYYVSIAQTGIFRSDDAGETWNNVTTNETNDVGLFESVSDPGNNNAELAVAADGRVYVGVAINGQTSYIGYSDDQGANWTQMDLPRTPESNGQLAGLNPRVKPGGQGAVHFAIAVDPDNSSVIYVGGDRQDGPFPNFIGASDTTGRLFRGDASQPRSATAPSPQWAHLTHRNTVSQIPTGGTGNNSAPHADSREIVFDALGDLIEVDDGGIYRRTQPTNNSGGWTSLNGNLAVTEFHDIAYDSVSNIIIGGAQDTGTPQQEAAGSTTWDSVSEADGGDVAVDDFSRPGVSTRYSSFQFLAGFRRRVYDANNNLISTHAPPLTVVDGGAPLGRQFVTPLELNKINPRRLLVGGDNSVYETLDQGETLREVGPGVGVNRGAIAYGGRRDGVANAAVAYVGSGEQVFVRTAESEPFQPTAAEFPGGVVNDIVLDPEDWTSAFVTDSNRVFWTVDGGASWLDVTGNLASAGLRTLEWIGGPTSALVVGALNGVVAMSLDRPGIWGQFGDGLPKVPVQDLDYDAADDVLIVGTQGRGAFSLPAASAEPLQVAPEIVVTRPSLTPTTTENQESITFQVYLTTAPAEPITIPVRSNDELEGTVDVTELVFSTTDWHTPQTLTITGVDDLNNDGDQAFSVVFGTTSSSTGIDPNYHGVDPPDVTVVNVDNESRRELFWVDHQQDAIVRASSNGDQVETIVDLSARFDADGADLVPRYIAVHPTARQLFWTDSGREEILRTDFSGGAIESIVTGVGEVRGLALDTTAGKIYWVDPAAEVIRRANLDGSGVEDIVSGELAGARELELDLTNAKVYWVDNQSGSIGRANLDGTGRETVIRDPGAGPTGLELDLQENKLYWSDITDDRILRADLDGSNVELVLDLAPITTSSAVAGVALDPSTGNLFWSDLASGNIHRTAVDRGVSELATSGRDPQGVAIAAVQPGISTSTPGGVRTAEFGTSVTVPVRLDTAPSQPVTIQVSTSDATEGTVDPGMLVFDATNWNVSQMVTVTGVDDGEGDGDINYSIVLEAQSEDPNYGSLAPHRLDARNADDELNLQVTELVPTSTGFIAHFSEDLDPAEINLIGSALASLGPGDLSLHGETTGPVAGSAVLNEAERSITFVATAGVLPVDRYTVTLKSGLDAFKSIDGIPLDGDGDRVSGGDYQTEFVMASPPLGSVEVGAANVVLGPGQAFSGDSAIPLTLSDGTNVGAVDLRIEYDADLLEVTAATVPDGLPEGASVVLNNTTPGLAILSFFSPTPLPAGEVSFAVLEANVPTTNANEIYRSKHLLDVHSITVSDGDDNELPALDRDAVHVVMYPGDVSGNGRVNAHDASLVARVGVELDEGFAGASLADPLLIGDVSGNDDINATDASKVAQHVALLEVDEIPPIPEGVVDVTSVIGPDPRLSFPRSLTATPGSTITVPLDLDSIVNLQAPNRLIGADVVAFFDPNVLTLDSVTPGGFMLSHPDWSVIPNINNTQGLVTLIAFSPTPVAGEFADVLLNLNFTVASNAPVGPTRINLAAEAAGRFTDLVDESDGFLELEGPVTNADDDPIDGVVTIVAGPTGWTNPSNRLDVDDSGTVSSNDVLVTVNELNLRRIIDASNGLPATRNSDQFFYDVDADGLVTALDVLALVNHLNFGSSGEGEGLVVSLKSEATPTPTDSPDIALLLASPTERGRLLSGEDITPADAADRDALFDVQTLDEWLVDVDDALASTVDE